MKGRVLICIYEFPASTSTSIRWVHFANYLSKNGWDVSVLTNKPSNTYAPIKVYKKIKIIYTKPGFLYRTSRDVLPPVEKDKKYSLSRYIKQHVRKALRKLSYTFLVPDPAIEWMIPILKLKKANFENVDVIISVNPPFTSHIVGYCFKKWLGVPWIIDMVDPWSLSPQTDVPSWRRFLDKKIERMIIKESDRIIFTTNEIIDAYSKEFPFIHKKNTELLTYGFSENNTLKLPPEFRIVYTGVFFDDIRNPTAFFQSLHELKGLKIKVIIAGPISSKYIEYVNNNGLSNCVKFLGHLTYKKALELQKNAAVLLLLGNKGGLQIPGKTYEYIGSRRPILEIRGDNNDIASKVIKKMDRGIIVENNEKIIANAIKYLYELYNNNKLNKTFSLGYRKEFSWSTLSKKMESLIIDTIKVDGL